MSAPPSDPPPGLVRLRDVDRADLSHFFDHQNDPEAARMAAFPAREREPFMAHWSKILADDSVIKQTILSGGQVAGNIVAFEQGGRRLVGYWLGRAFWGQGVATRALLAFLGLVKKRPLYAHVARHNLGSIRVLEKCGFVLLSEEPVDAEGVEELVYVLEG